jgi:hypothetical protein
MNPFSRVITDQNLSKDSQGALSAAYVLLSVLADLHNQQRAHADLRDALTPYSEVQTILAQHPAPAAPVARQCPYTALFDALAPYSESEFVKALRQRLNCHVCGV